MQIKYNQYDLNFEILCGIGPGASNAALLVDVCDFWGRPGQSVSAGRRTSGPLTAYRPLTTSG